MPIWSLYGALRRLVQRVNLPAWQLPCYTIQYDVTCALGADQDKGRHSIR